MQQGEDLLSFEPLELKKGVGGTDLSEEIGVTCKWCF